MHDHADEHVWQAPDSIDFATLLHSAPPGIYCCDHGIALVEMPWSDRSSKFTARSGTMDILISAVVKGASWIL